VTKKTVSGSAEVRQRTDQPRAETDPSEGCGGFGFQLPGHYVLAPNLKLEINLYEQDF